MEKVIKLEIPVRRAKGSQGDITVEWSLFQNDSSDTLDFISPTSGMLSMADGQWKDSLILNIDNNGEGAPESVIWVKLENPTGGALLATSDKTTAKILLASNVTDKHSKWIIVAVGVFVAAMAVLFLASWGIGWHIV